MATVMRTSSPPPPAAPGVHRAVVERFEHLEKGKPGALYGDMLVMHFRLANDKPMRAYAPWQVTPRNKTGKWLMALGLRQELIARTGSTFDVDRLRNRPCRLLIVERVSANGNTYANVKEVMPPKAEAPTPSEVADDVVVDDDATANSGGREIEPADDVAPETDTTDYVDPDAETQEVMDEVLADEPEAEPEEEAPAPPPPPRRTAPAVVRPPAAAPKSVPRPPAKPAPKKLPNW